MEKQSEEVTVPVVNTDMMQGLSIDDNKAFDFLNAQPAENFISCVGEYRAFEPDENVVIIATEIIEIPNKTYNPNVPGSNPTVESAQYKMQVPCLDSKGVEIVEKGTKKPVREVKTFCSSDAMFLNAVRQAAKSGKLPKAYNVMGKGKTRSAKGEYTVLEIKELVKVTTK